MNGLRNAKKRQNIFNWFNKQNVDLVMIQETHCENEQSQNEWKTDWKGKSFWSHGTNLSKGVAFLIHEQATFKVIDYEVFVTGRLISLKVEINDQKLQILNIYAPNNSSDRK